MRLVPRAPALSAALVLLLTASAPLAAAQDDTTTEDLSEFFPNACRDVDPMTVVSSGYGNPLTVMLNGESAEPELIETGVAQATLVGPGKDGDRTHFLNVSVPDEEDPLVGVKLLTARVDLDNDGPEDGLEAEAWTNAKVAEVNILDGLITADVVRAFAYARADVRSARTDTDASTIVNLKIAGISETDVSPGANISLPAALFGPGAYLTVYERVDASAPPTEDFPFYVADVRVRMLHLYAPNMILLGHVDIVVSEAHSRAVSPTPFCGVAQTVEGGGYIVRVRDGLEEPGILVGEQHIGVTGGNAHQQLLGQTIALLGADLRLNITETDITASIEAGVSSHSRSMSRVVGLCIRLDASQEECFIKATVIQAVAECHADVEGASCTGDVQILELVVNGVDVVAALNLDGLGHPTVAGEDPTYNVGPIGIWLNQQERVESDGYASLYVRAIRIETGLPAIGTIVIGRAYAAASFEAAGTVDADTDPWSL